MSCVEMRCLLEFRVERRVFFSPRRWKGGVAAASLFFVSRGDWLCPCPRMDGGDWARSNLDARVAAWVFALGIEFLAIVSVGRISNGPLSLPSSVSV